jgi:hypothetical protein
MTIAQLGIDPGAPQSKYLVPTDYSSTAPYSRKEGRISGPGLEANWNLDEMLRLRAVHRDPGRTLAVRCAHSVSARHASSCSLFLDYIHSQLDLPGYLTRRLPNPNRFTSFFLLLCLFLQDTAHPVFFATAASFLQVLRVLHRALSRSEA